MEVREGMSNVVLTLGPGHTLREAATRAYEKVVESGCDEFAEHDNVVKAFPSDRTDQPFGISVLPWGARRCRPVTNAH